MKTQLATRRRPLPNLEGLPPFLAVELTTPSPLRAVTADEGATGSAAGMGTAGLAGATGTSATPIDAASSLGMTLMAVTPRLMRFSDTTWLLDLSLVASYWQARASARSSSRSRAVAEPSPATALGLISELLAGLFPDGYRAAAAEHPWRALLLVGQMRERRLTGLFASDGPFGERLFRELTWDIFWQRTSELSEHLAATTRKRFDCAMLRRQSEQMRRAVRRLGIAAPWSMKDVPALAMRRRFGAVLRDVWEWTYGVEAAASASSSLGGTSTPLFPSLSESDVGPAGVFAAGFPWQGFAPATLPAVTRHLDTPVWEWAHLEPLLREDFDRLTPPGDGAGERVVSLEWRLVLHDLSHLTVPIIFRHPHCLGLERGHHATALLQALYAFEAQIALHGKESGLGDVAPVIVGWELRLEERLVVPPRLAGFFGDVATLDPDGRHEVVATAEEMTLLSLENKLKIPLLGYGTRADWTPEDAYAAVATGKREPRLDEMAAIMREAHRQSLGALAARRPLYLYKRPSTYDNKGRSSAWEFLERTMAKWWARGSASERELQRDYYRLVDGDGRTLWVFKDTVGRWFVHGVFA